MSERVFISLGSNLGDGEANIVAAVERITSEPSITFVTRSPLYLTEPLGTGPGPRFTNCVVEVSTRYSPLELLIALKRIENDMGRTGARRWAPRIIDLDIIFFADRIVREQDLTVPHPLMHERGFVVFPLCDIAPEFMHPVLGKTVSKLAKGLSRDGVERIADLSC